MRLKVLAVLLLLSTTLGFSQVSSKPVQLTLVMEGSASRQELLAKVLDRFTRTYPTVTVKPVWIQMDNGSWADYFTKIQTMIAGGQAPDVVRCAIEGIQMMAKKDLALPLNAYLKKEPALQEDYKDLHPNLQSAFEFGGNIYGMTWDWNNMITHINLDMLKAAGLPFPDKDWNEATFLKYAKALTRTANGQKVYGCAVPDFYFAVNSWLYNFGGAFLSDDQKKSALDTPQALECFQFIHDLIYKYQVAPVPQPGIDFINQFASKKIAMCFGGRWPVPTFIANKINFDIQYQPSFRTNQVIFGSGAFPVLKSSRHPYEAFLLSTFLGGKYSQETLLTEDSIPTRISIMEKVLPAKPPKNAILYRKSADIARAVQAPPCYPALGLIFGRYFSEMMTNQISVEEGVQGMHREFSDALAQDD
jgi:multiple sugar transport system substrate-binding protein